MTQALEAPSSSPIARRSPWNKPEKSRLILLATTSIVSAILAIWLLMWVLFREPGAVAAGWLGLSGVAGPFIPFQAEDATAFGQSLETGTRIGSPVADVRRAIGDAIARKGSGPLVIYLSAVGLSHDGRAYLLPVDETPFVTSRQGEDALTSVESILDLLTADPDREKLLILDAGRVGSDRDLGVFANGFLQQLDTTLKSKSVPKLAVLASSSPGQESHVSSADRRSAFAYYVARGLSGDATNWDSSGRVTVQGLARYVRAHVGRWAESCRQAVQTPVLLGDTTLNFPLQLIGEHRITGQSVEDFKVLETVLDSLKAAWTNRDALANQHPYRNAPLLWRRYLDGLLRAEQLARAGQVDLAQEVLTEMKGLGDLVARRAAGLPLDRAWSLALGNSLSKSLTSAERDALDVSGRSLRRTIDRIAGLQDPDEIVPSTMPPSPGGSGATAVIVEGPTTDPNTGSTTDATRKSARPRSPETASRLDESLIELTGNLRVPRYLEAQLAVWADAYLAEDLGPSFEGRRSLTLQKAQSVRTLAERAAAPDERVARRIEPLLERADAIRRSGQDLLFGPEGEGLERSVGLLDEAARLYEAILAQAGAEAEALDLVERLQAELPELASWKARQGRSGLEESFLATLLDGAEALAIRLRASPEFGDPERLSSDVLAAQISAVTRETDALVDRVRSAYESLVREFLTMCELAGSSRASTRLAEVDDLLRVPLIPAEQRMTLLAKSRTLSLAHSLAEEAEAVAQPDLAVGLEDPKSDPVFWAHALGLAKVECTLLMLGGADPLEIQGLRSDLEAARGAITHREVAFAAFDRINRRVRSIRAGLTRTVQSVAGGLDRALDDDRLRALAYSADAAARTLPKAFVITMADNSSPDLQRARLDRQLTLRRLGRRLAEDYAPEHARQLFDAARAILPTSGIDADLARVDVIGRSRLMIDHGASGSVSIGSEPGQVWVSVTSEGVVPEGLALIALPVPPGRPITVEAELGSDAEQRRGTGPAALVAVGASPAPTKESFLLRRTEYSAQVVQFPLRPGLFYRGRIIQAATPVQVVLSPREEEVQVGLRQHTVERGLRDQFDSHPMRGYLHFNSTLHYDLALLNKTNKELTVWVKASLDGADPAVATVKLQPGVLDRSLEGRVQAIAPTEPLAPNPDGTPGTPIEPGPFDVPLNRPRILSVEVREKDANGRLLGIPRTFEFHQQPISQYAAASAQFDPKSGYLWVRAYHLASDKVEGPIKFTAHIAGETIEIDDWIPKGRYAEFRSSQFFPPYPEKIPWSIDAGYKIGAFNGEAPTNATPPVPTAAPSAGSAPLPLGAGR